MDELATDVLSAISQAEAIVAGTAPDSRRHSLAMGAASVLQSLHADLVARPRAPEHVAPLRQLLEEIVTPLGLGLVPEPAGAT